MDIKDRTVKAELRVGSRTCQCGLCGDFFGSPSAFDKHLIGLEQTRCRTHRERVRAGMVQNEHGVWLKGGKAQD